MKTIVFNIQTLDSALADFSQAWKTGTAETQTRLAFQNWELMHKVLSPKRLEIIRIMAGAGPLSIREISRRIGRDFKGVHTDIRALLDAGVVDRDDLGKLVFPYDRIHVDFEIPAAA